MVWLNPLWTISVAAGMDLPNEHRFVVIKPSGVELAQEPTDFLAGVLLNTPRKGETALVCVLGVVMVEAGGGILPGSLVGSAMHGLAVPLPRGRAYLAGIALACADTGEKVPILLCHYGLRRS